MPTPTQPVVTIDTPYGTALLRDARSIDDRDSSDLAYFYFDEVTVNRKKYTDVRFVLKRGHTSEHQFRIYNDSYRSGLTESAQTKIADALALHDDKFSPYFEDLDDATKRAQVKYKLRYELKQGIYKAAPSDYHKGPEYDLKTELIDEIMGELMEYRKSGLTWSQIYFDKD